MMGNDASGLVALSVVVAVGSAEIASVIKGTGPKAKPIIGGFLLGAFLLAMAAINAQLAEAFCILVIIAALLTNGLTVFFAINNVTTGPVAQTVTIPGVK